MLSTRALLAPRWIAIAIPLILVPLTLGSTPDIVSVIAVGSLLAATAVALDFMVGYAGQPNMGQGAFYALGAYGSSALLVEGLPFELSVVITALATGVAAGILGAGALRLAHIGLALVTFTFAYVMFVILGGTLLQQYTGASGGLAVPPGTFLSLDLSDLTVLTLVSIGLLTVTVVAAQWVLVTRYGRIVMTIKRSDVLASVLGIAVFRVKMFVLVLCSIPAAIAGAFSAQSAGFISPDSYTATFSITLLAIVAVGGMGTILGPVIAAFVFVYLGHIGSSNLSSGMWWPALFLITLILLPRGLAGVGLDSLALIGARAGRTSRRKARPRSDAPSGVATEVHNAEPVDGASLTVEHLTVSYGGMKAISDVSFKVRKGTVHALVGPNGAGKTSLLNVLAGVTRPSEGRVALDDLQLATLRIHDRARHGIARSFQHAMLVDDLSVVDNVRVAMENSTANARDKVSDHQVHAALKAAGVPDDLWARKADELAGGEQKVVDMARAMASRPRLLLLDEPTSGVSRDEIRAIVLAIENARSSGATVLLIDHNVPFVEEVADSVTVLDFGTVIADGDPTTTLRRPEVVAAFIGESTTKGTSHA